MIRNRFLEGLQIDFGWILGSNLGGHGVVTKSLLQAFLAPRLLKSTLRASELPKKPVGQLFGPNMARRPVQERLQGRSWTEFWMIFETFLVECFCPKEPGSQRGREQASQRGRAPESQQARKSASQRTREPESQRAREPESQRTREPESLLSFCFWVLGDKWKAQWRGP